MAAFDCYFANFKANHSDGGYCIKIFNGPGPYKFVNNYLEASGINFFSGGEAITLPNNIPSNIEFRNNYVTKRAGWGGAWWIKCLFELKDAQYVLIEGNIFYNCYYDSIGTYGATALAFTVRGAGPNGTNSTIRDVTVRYNIIRDVGTGFRISPSEGSTTTQQMQRVLIENCVFDDIKRAYYVHAKAWSFTVDTMGYPPALDVTVRHNLFLFDSAGGYDTGLFDSVGPICADDLVMEYNIMDRHSDYGIMGNGSYEGKGAFSDWTQNSRIYKNVIIGGFDYPLTGYPTGSPYYFANPADISVVGFTDADNKNYLLQNGSPYKGWCDDGADPGPDIVGLSAATGGVIVGKEVSSPRNLRIRH